MHMKKLSGKKIAKNMMLSVLAQAVSVLVGFVLNLIVPKFIPESDYSLWQSYLLYSQYLGVLHFGLMDGIVLRYARFDYDELDKDMVRSQYRLIMELDLLLSAGLLAIGCLLFRGDNRVLCILLACTVCIEITFNYISFTFQITNRITHYVAYIAVYRVIYCLLVLGCLAAGQSSYIWFCLVYLAADVAVILFFGLRYSRRLLVGSMVPRARLLPELRTTLSAGVWLMLSSYAANFLVGSGKMVIQWRWGLLVFGKVSLAFSLTSFFLQFVTAISVVLFPSIKRMEPGQAPGHVLPDPTGDFPAAVCGYAAVLSRLCAAAPLAAKIRSQCVVSGHAAAADYLHVQGQSADQQLPEGLSAGADHAAHQRLLRCRRGWRCLLWGHGC